MPCLEKKKEGGHRSSEFHSSLNIANLCSKLCRDSQHYKCQNEQHASGVYLGGKRRVFIYR